MLKPTNQDDYIDQVAQAVIDRIEENSRIAHMVEMVAQRVLQLQQEQKEETVLQAAADAGASDHDAHPTGTDTGE